MMCPDGIADSVQTTDNTCKIGTKVALVVSPSPLPPEKCILSWIDDGWPGPNCVSMVYSDNLDLPKQLGSTLDDFISPTSKDGVWFLGSKMVLKAKDWREEMELEADTLRFVKQNFPKVPVPDVRYSWIDISLHRSFFLMTRCAGETLLKAWPTLCKETRNDIAKQAAELCKSLSALNSPKFESPTERGIFEPLLDKSEGDEIKVIGPFSAANFDSFISSNVTYPDFMRMEGKKFVFYHPDLNPGNIFIADGVITGIIDWDGAGYYPSYYVAAKIASHGFMVDVDCDQDDAHEWQKALWHCLKRVGFYFRKEFWEWYDRWSDS